jgi:hypothetical protein
MREPDGTLPLLIKDKDSVFLAESYSEVILQLNFIADVVGGYFRSGS